MAAVKARVAGALCGVALGIAIVSADDNWGLDASIIAWIAVVIIAAVAGAAVGTRLPLSNRAEPYQRRAPRMARRI